MKYLLLAILGVGGVAGGLYLAGDSLPGSSQSCCSLPDTTSPPQSPLRERFALTALDAKDQVEAPSLTADAAGRVYLAWASKTSDTERTIFLSRCDASTFAPARAIAKAAVYRSVSRTTGKVGYERRATPHVAADGKTLLLAWSEALEDGSSMQMVLTTSTDGGGTFSPPRAVHRGPNAKATFTDMAVGPGGTVACTWLDDRAGVQQPYVATRREGAADFESEQLVYAGHEAHAVCPCCATAAAFAANGMQFVAFRNVLDGYRDIAVSRKKPGQMAFQTTVQVVPPTWKFDGCPHDGPSLATAGDKVHVVWMDARSGAQRCYYAWSDQGDLKFEARDLHPIATDTQGNARLFADRAGALHAVWEQSLGAEASEAHAGHAHGPPKVGAGGGRAIYYSRMPPGKTDFGPATAIEPKPGVFQTRPAIVATPGGELFVAWNELDEAGKAVVVTRLPATGGRQ